ncbi:hypothetical protein DBR47_22755 [Paucibacter sp. KBW04]|nr:hypothetical protein DBR47_22755 [Paucibacter sp. KBW04]
MQGELRAPPVPETSGSISVSIPGTVTQQIGSGEHAQNSIVYRTILWSFIGGGALSTASIVIALAKGNASALTEIKDVWSIFAPLITLALGYLFGKGR